jgi:hypothetical protein
LKDDGKPRRAQPSDDEIRLPALISSPIRLTNDSLHITKTI